MQKFEVSNYQIDVEIDLSLELAMSLLHTKVKCGSTKKDSIRSQYEKYGAQKYYEAMGCNYQNPHEKQIQVGLPQALTLWQNQKFLGQIHKLIDLACGSGEITLIAKKFWPQIHTIGIDPYTHQAYKDRIGNDCVNLSFEDVAKMNFTEDLRCDLIICSYALHLLDSSYLWQLLTVLSMLTSKLVIITPHKNPQIQPHCGWTLIDEQRFDQCHQRYRLYTHTKT